jgi:hypothetical protein
MGKPNYEKPTSQVDLERRLKDDYVSPSVLGQAVDPVLESENGYVGVDPIYQNFANETEKPYASEKGVEKKLEAPYYGDKTDFDKGATPEGEAEAEEQEEDEGQSSSGTTTTPDGGGSGAAPAAPTLPPSGQNS